MLQGEQYHRRCESHHLSTDPLETYVRESGKCLSGGIAICRSDWFYRCEACVCVCVVHTANVRNKGQLDGEEAGLCVFW